MTSHMAHIVCGVFAPLTLVLAVPADVTDAASHASPDDPVPDMHSRSGSNGACLHLGSIRVYRVRQPNPAKASRTGLAEVSPLEQTPPRGAD